MKLLVRLNKEKLIHPPKFVLSNTAYMTMMGSIAYGVSTDASDVDVYGFCVPPKDVVFPHTVGVVKGFGHQGKEFKQWQEHHINDKSADKEYDFSIYSIVRYFQLCMDNNPNMIDSLFVPRRCILHSTQVGEYVRENRRLFLHKGCYHKFKGYAYSQMHKMRIKDPEKGSKRYDMVQKYGYDLKFAYHLVRLLNECEQILIEGDLDLQRNREQLKSIRRGEWSMAQVEEYFEKKEMNLEELYVKSDLPHQPDEEVLKGLLLEALELHYGSIDECITTISSVEKDMQRIAEIMSKYQ